MDFFQSAGRLMYDRIVVGSTITPQRWFLHSYSSRSSCDRETIMNSLSGEFPRNSLKQALMAQSACSGNSMCGPAGRWSPLKFSSAAGPHGRRVTGHRWDKTRTRCLVFSCTTGQMTGTRHSHAWMQRQLPSRDMANSSLTVQRVTENGERRLRSWNGSMILKYCYDCRR